ncbi:MAG: AMP-binding protein [Duodenibacillus sp.]|nr:AMP-binding protein [Duodenibacillus sp.]
MTFPWLAKYPEGIPAEINPDLFPSIPGLFDAVAAKHPDHPAFVCMDAAITYRQFCKLSEDFAGYLQSIPGLEKGDRVALMMPNLPQYMIALVGIMRAGMIAVNVNPLYTSRELAHQLVDSGSKAIIIIENFARTLEVVLGETPVKHIITTKVGDMLPWYKRLAIDFAVRYVKKMVPQFSLPGHVNFRAALAQGRRCGFKRLELSNGDIALLQYTGGTTGVAKGAMLTHRNVLANVEQTGNWISQAFLEAQEVSMTALPIYHIFSFTATLCFAKHAAMQVLVPNARDIPGLVQLCRKYSFSCIPGVNTLYNAMLNNKGFRELDFSRLKVCVGGGAQVQKTVAERWAKITGCPILEAYGLTEASPGVCGNLPGAPWDGSVGFPLPSTVVSIRGDDFQDLGICTDPERVAEFTGEICVKGPQVMLGYWEKPEESAKVLVDGWLRTGDVGHIDAEGRVTITDRKKDLIIVNGFNVYPNEIESVIASMPGVLEVGVVGVKNPRLGETIKAVIVKKDPALTRDDVVKYCRQQLTGYKVPRTIVFVDALPKTAVGKILRRNLKDVKES